MAKILINGKEYPVPERFTMGELADIEMIAGQGYEMDGGKVGPRGVLAIAYVSVRRIDKSLTLDQLRDLPADAISAVEEEDASPPSVSVKPANSSENGGSSNSSSETGSVVDLAETHEVTGLPV